MRRLAIALDCDGLLADFVVGLLDIVAEVTGKRFVPADVTGYAFERSLGLTYREAAAVKKIIGSHRGFALGLPPYPSARQGVRRLRELGDVFCVTSPWDSNPWWREEREAWLALHFGIDRVHHALDKSSYAADVFVDDRSANVSAWARAWPGSLAVLWRTPHNGAEPTPAGAHAVACWDELYDLVCREVLRLPGASMEVAS